MTYKKPLVYLALVCAGLQLANSLGTNLRTSFENKGYKTFQSQVFKECEDYNFSKSDYDNDQFVRQYLNENEHILTTNKKTTHIFDKRDNIQYRVQNDYLEEKEHKKLENILNQCIINNAKPKQSKLIII